MPPEGILTGAGREMDGDLTELIRALFAVVFVVVPVVVVIVVPVVVVFFVIHKAECLHPYHSLLAFASKVCVKTPQTLL